VNFRRNAKVSGGSGVESENGVSLQVSGRMKIEN
jgi:hypothetical protein